MRKGKEGKLPSTWQALRLAARQGPAGIRPCKAELHTCKGKAAGPED